MPMEPVTVRGERSAWGGAWDGACAAAMAARLAPVARARAVVHGATAALFAIAAGWLVLFGIGGARWDTAVLGALGVVLAFPLLLAAVALVRRARGAAEAERAGERRLVFSDDGVEVRAPGMVTTLAWPAIRAVRCTAARLYVVTDATAFVAKTGDAAAASRALEAFARRTEQAARAVPDAGAGPFRAADARDESSAAEPRALDASIPEDAWCGVGVRASLPALARAAAAAEGAPTLVTVLAAGVGGVTIALAGAAGSRGEPVPMVAFGVVWLVAAAMTALRGRLLARAMLGDRTVRARLDEGALYAFGAWGVLVRTRFGETRTEWRSVREVADDGEAIRLRCDGVHVLPHAAFADVAEVEQVLREAERRLGAGRFRRTRAAPPPVPVPVPMPAPAPTPAPAPATTTFGAYPGVMLFIDDSGVSFGECHGAMFTETGGPLGDLRRFVDDEGTQAFVRERFGEDVLRAALADARMRLARRGA